MFDFCYKLARKSTPRFFYEVFRSSYFGRRKFLENIDIYREHFLKYQEVAQTGFTNKIVLEVGSGDQIFTALFFLNQGCRRVIIVDPKIEIIDNAERLASAISVFKAACPQFSMSESEVKERILTEKNCCKIADSFNNGIDFIFSHTVLEHFQDLDEFYSNVRRLLAQDGVSFNKVDLSDHTYHIFSRFKFSHPLARWGRLSHLRYSDKTFALLNDPKCYMNRKPLPLYCQKAKAYNLKCRITEKELFDRAVKVHKDVVKELDAFDKEDINVLQFWMFLEKR
jgi:SAM-dependent methyltransferase